MQEKDLKTVKGMIERIENENIPTIIEGIKIFEKRFNINDKFGKEILQNYNLQLQKYKEYVYLYNTKTFLCENKLNEIIGETGEISDKITHLLSIRSLQISTLSLEEILKRK